MRSLLIVDDDEVMAEALTSYLQYEGFECCVAHTGAEAVELLTRCMQLPEAILVDIMLPIKGGVELVKALAADPKWARIPALILMGASEDEIPDLGHARHVLRKPVHMDIIVSALKCYCRRVA